MADQLIRATAADGGIRAVGIITTHLAQEARERHRLSYVATAALARAMTGALLLASNMKKAGSRVNIRLKGDGPLRSVTADAGVDGTVRGYVTDPGVEIALSDRGGLNVGGAVGRSGYVHVMRDEGSGTPYTSTTELVSGEVGEDLTYYLANSEQTPSSMILGEFINADGVVAAGGLLIQILPKAADNDLLVTILESRISEMQSFTAMLRSGQQLPDIMAEILGDLGLEIFPEVQPVQFRCPCSHKRVLGALKLLGQDELQDMINQNEIAEATCHFCNTVYYADVDELQKLLDELRSRAIEAS
ncbi:Hsp33 family molecular chaperone HslO [Alkalinema pantanalense CENA528]|uniref:Hsp33 family molecular chaperone HslO n=1 Tax=Alkalinema pantanalense TaxID=1620705 RepID=UPI003D6E6BBB